MYNPAKTRLALYARVSTDEQKEKGESIDQQIALGIDFGRMRGFTPPFCLYVDEGFSAKSVEGRPAMRLLMEDIQSGKVQHFAARDFRRVWRNVKDSYVYLEHIVSAGCGFSLITQPVDISTAMGRAFFGMQSVFSQLQREMTGEEARGVLCNIVAKKGRYIGAAPPYGYRYNKEEKALYPHPEEMEVVKEIFRLFLEEGLGYIPIQRELDRRGVPTRKGNLWNPATVKNILTNPIYNGEVIWGRPRRKPPEWAAKEAESRIARGAGKHEPLISPEEWQRAQDKAASTVKGRPFAARYPYSGLLFCGSCGSRMTTFIPSKGDNPSYGCARRIQHGKTSCPESSFIRIHLLEKMVTKAIADNIKEADAAGWRIERAPERKPKVSKKEREKWETYIANNRQMYREGLILHPEYIEHERIGQAKLKAMEEEADPVTILPPLAGDFADFESMILSREGSFADKKAVIKQWLLRVEIRKDRLTLHFIEAEWRGWRKVIEVARR